MGEVVTNYIVITWPPTEAVALLSVIYFAGILFFAGLAFRVDAFVWRALRHREPKTGSGEQTGQTEKNK